MSGELLPPDPDRARRDPPGAPEPEVGRFRTDDALTGAALARYLVGRVLTERVSISLYVLGGVIAALAVVCWIFGPHWLAILVLIVALAVLAMRALLIGLLRKVLAFGRFGPVEDRIRALVKDSQGDLRRELKRIGLPASVVTMPLLVPRLLGRRRRDTIDRMARFDVARVVPPHRQDEFSLLVREALDRPSRPTP